MPHKPSVLFRRTKRPINFAHLLLKMVGQLVEAQSHRAIGRLVRKAAASDDLTLNSDEVVQNIYLRGSLSSGESGLPVLHAGMAVGCEQQHSAQRRGRCAGGFTFSVFLQ
jgi:hypothetical protein